MNRRVAAKLSSIAFCLLVAASVLLAAAVLAFVSLSAYGTQQRDALRAGAEAVFIQDWITHKTLPVDLPLQQLIVVSESGEIVYSIPAKVTGSVEDYADSNVSSRDGQVQAASLLGQVLEPLMDRYAYIGRTPTFLILSCPQQNNTILSAALWLPLSTRLIWTSYAAVIYLYLVHWPFSILWVYLDARVRGTYPWKWTMFTALANIVGLACYLVVCRRQGRGDGSRGCFELDF